MKIPNKKELKRFWRRIFPTERAIHKSLDELEKELELMKDALREWANGDPKVAQALKKAGLL